MDWIVRSSSAALAFTAVFGVSLEAEARPTGEPWPCHNCHYETNGPTIDVSFSTTSLDPSETIRITIDVEANHFEAQRTGVYMFTADQGEFVLVDPDTTRYATEETTAGVVHSAPRTFDANGRASFEFDWTAPAEVGVSDFTVFSISGNTNGESSDDHWAETSASVAHGCDALVYYPDIDGDGFGDMNLGVLSCDPVPGYLLDGGDCDDTEVDVRPGAEELCNVRDDDCDGETDEGLEPGLYYPDPDGDGYAADGETAELGCNNSEGLAPELGDCAPDDPNVHPGAPEVENGEDDDCDGEIDEDIDEEPESSDDDGEGDSDDGAEDGGVQTSGATAGAADGGDGDSGGCRVGTPAHRAWWLALPVLLRLRRRSR